MPWKEEAWLLALEYINVSNTLADIIRVLNEDPTLTPYKDFSNFHRLVRYSEVDVIQFLTTPP